MLRKLPFTILCIFLLLQCTFSKSVTNAIDDDSSEEESIGKITIEDESSPHVQLLFAVLEKFADISVTTLKTGKKLIQDVIADVSQIQDKPKELRSKLTELEQFVTKLERLDLNDQVAKFEAVAELSDLLERYNGTAPNDAERHWTSIDATFKTALKENGLEQAAHEFVENFLDFVKWFNPKAEAYWQALSPKEKVVHVKFDVWFQEFKDEKDPEKLIVKFEEFFARFE